MKYLFIVVLAFCITIFSFSQGYSIESKSIIGIWLLDEGKGNIVNDSSVNGRHGEIKGDLKWVKGKYSNALSFPGQSGNYVFIPHDDGLSVKTFSITAWVNLVNKGQYQALVEKGEVNGDNRNFYLAVMPEGILYGGFKGQNGWNSIIADVIADEKWHHAAVTYDMKKILVYLDGKSYTKVAFGLEGGIDPLQNEAGVTFGATNVSGTEPVQGIIDEVGIFNQALSEEDIKSIMQNGLERGALSVKPIGKLATVWGNIK
ncbi:MAG: LamG domain-containing protein [bacterium]